MATVASILEQYNIERPNQIDDNIKMQWLKKVEKMLINEVIIQHEHDLTDNDRISLVVVGSTLKITPAGTLEEHLDSFDMDTHLLVDEPYDDLYIFYMDQRKALMENDTKRYNVASTQYNNAYYAYQQYFNRTYKTKSQPKLLFEHRNL